MRSVMVIIFTLWLTGCSWFTQTIYVDKPVPYQRAPLNIEQPNPLVLHNVSVILVKPEGEPAYFMLDPESYKGILLNNKQIEGYIRQANQRIRACEAYYTAPIEEWVSKKPP